MLARLSLFGVILAACLLCSGPLFAQSWIIEETYGGNLNDRAFNLVSQANGNVTHVGLTNSFGNPAFYPNAHVVQSNPLGANIWEMVYNVRVAVPANSTVYETEMSIIECANGDFVWTTGIVPFPGAQTDIIVVRTNPVGNVLWAAFIGGANGGNDYSTSVIETQPSGDLLITGYTDAPPTAGGVDILAARLTAAGVLLWGQRYGAINNDYGRCIREMTNGNFVIVGESNSFNPTFDGIQLSITGGGALNWSFRHGLNSENEGFSTVMQHANNGDLYTSGISWTAGNGNNWIVRTDPNTGATVNGATYDAVAGGTEGAWYIDHAQNKNDMVVTGQMPGVTIGGPFDGYFLEIPANLGAAINFRAYGTTFDDRLRTISYSAGNPGFPFTQGGYWAVGWTGANGAGNIDEYLIRSNLVGKTGCDMVIPTANNNFTTSNSVTLTLRNFAWGATGGVPTTAIMSQLPLCAGMYVPTNAVKTGVGGNIEFTPALLINDVTVYPQPLRVGYDAVVGINTNRDAELQIVLNDMQGREVMSMPFSAVAGDNQATIQPRGLSSGAYILQVKGQGQSFSSNVMILE